MVSKVEDSRELRILQFASTVCSTQRSSWVVICIDFLAANNVGHEDLHTGNLAIVVPGLDSLNEEDSIAKLGKFDIGAVTKLDDGPWAPN
ncbi:hypothetical protein E4U19_007180, partial [Claviceps sp. Clav32 group G5]